jgi:hypothetical protein
MGFPPKSAIGAWRLEGLLARQEQTLDNRI